MHCLSSVFLFTLIKTLYKLSGLHSFVCSADQLKQSKNGAVVFTVEVELQTVCIDVVQWNVQLSGYMLHDAAEAS